MKKSIICMFVVSAVFVCGCGLTFEAKKAELLQTITPEDYGILPVNHQDTEKRYILDSLKDPDSAKFEWGGSRKDIMQKSFFDITAIPVIVTDVRVNAKNSYGGYTGYNLYEFAWKGGRLFAVARDKINSMAPDQTYRSWDYIK